MLESLLAEWTFALLFSPAALTGFIGLVFVLGCRRQMAVGFWPALLAFTGLAFGKLIESYLVVKEYDDRTLEEYGRAIDFGCAVLLTVAVLYRRIDSVPSRDVGGTGD